MPVINNNVSVAANATNSNVLAGEMFEFLPPGRHSISLALSGSAAGIVATFSVGGVTVAERIVLAPTNRSPILPDDFVTSIGGVGGERLLLQLSNTTSGALVGNWTVRID
jgi:hypothetical protein